MQGVFFRANTKKKAEELGISGWVRNLSDGRVEAVFEGEEERLNELINWCKESIPLARVEGVEKAKEELEGLRGFRIIR